MKSRVVLAGIFALILANAAPAHAGMPSIGLTDIAMLRLSTISFFIACLLGASWILQRIWNGLTNDFPRLPKLSYGRACGLVTLWSFLFLLILTMISGARELMTPGAWKKEGYVYVLNDDHQEPKPNDNPKLEVRRESLNHLKSALWDYAKSHDGSFPPQREVPEIPKILWQVPDISAMPYFYQPSKLTADAVNSIPLAYEPGIFGPTRLVLFNDGTIRELSSADLDREIDRGAKR